MEVRAFAKSVRVSPRKIRLIADTIRNKPAEEAVRLLSLVPKRAALPLQKTVKSAIANAVHNAKANSSMLFIKRIEVAEGQALKRFHPSTRGRVHPYKKKSSHIEVILEERKNNGTKN